MKLSFFCLFFYLFSGLSFAQESLKPIMLESDGQFYIARDTRLSFGPNGSPIVLVRSNGLLECFLMDKDSLNPTQSIEYRNNTMSFNRNIGYAVNGSVFTSYYKLGANKLAAVHFDFATNTTSDEQYLNSENVRGIMHLQEGDVFHELLYDYDINVFHWSSYTGSAEPKTITFKPNESAADFIYQSQLPDFTKAPNMGQLRYRTHNNRNTAERFLLNKQWAVKRGEHVYLSRLGNDYLHIMHLDLKKVTIAVDSIAILGTSHYAMSFTDKEAVLLEHNGSSMVLKYYDLATRKNTKNTPIISKHLHIDQAILKDKKGRKSALKKLEINEKDLANLQPVVQYPLPMWEGADKITRMDSFRRHMHGEKLYFQLVDTDSGQFVYIGRQLSVDPLANAPGRMGGFSKRLQSKPAMHLSSYLHLDGKQAPEYHNARRVEGERYLAEQKYRIFKHAEHADNQYWLIQQFGNRTRLHLYKQ